MLQRYLTRSRLMAQRVIGGPVAPPIPPAVQALGWTLQWGGIPVMDTSWYDWNWLTRTPILGQSVQKSDRVTLPGANGSGYNATICTAKKVGSSWTGTLFKSPNAIVIDCQFPAIAQSGGLPNAPSPLWREQIEYLQQGGGTSLDWPGSPTYMKHMEPDDWEWDMASTQYISMSMGLDWWGLKTGSQISHGPVSPNNLVRWSVPGQRQRLMRVLMNASPTNQGYWDGYINDVQVQPIVGTPKRYLWNYWDPLAPPVPEDPDASVADGTMFSFIDQVGCALISGTVQNGTCPLDIFGVWVYGPNSSILVQQ